MQNPVRLLPASVFLTALAVAPVSALGGGAVEIGGGLAFGYEPSGAVWHPKRNQLLIVSDDGVVTALDANGANVQDWVLGGPDAGADLEAIAYADPESDLVYLGREHPDAVLEFDLVSGTVVRTFALDGTLTSVADNDGLEALTFVPLAGHPEGGEFYAGLQEDGQIYRFDLSIATSAVLTTVTHVGTIAPAPGYTDLSGLDFERAAGVLYALFDGANRVVTMDAAGALILDAALPPGNDQEGVALRGCELFVAEDVGPEVWVYDCYPGTVCDILAVDVPALSATTGGVQNFALTAGLPNAGLHHWLLGTLNETVPGQSVGGFLLPLNPDPWFLYTLFNPNSGPLGNSLGLLDANGDAAATFTLGAGAPAALVGRTAWHAFVVVDLAIPAVVDASNAVPLTILP